MSVVFAACCASSSLVCASVITIARCVSASWMSLRASSVSVMASSYTAGWSWLMNTHLGEEEEEEVGGGGGGAGVA